jgi:CheY-like chemotaxis protein
LKRAFRATEINNSLVTVENGDKADFLTGSVSNRNPIPSLVLLDLNMPYKNGLEVLQWIRAQQSLFGLPVVVLTSSNQDTDIVRAYESGVSGYLIKPGSPKDLEAIARALKDYWLIHNRPATSLLATSKHR